jgi:cytochrome c556
LTSNLKAAWVVIILGVSMETKVKMTKEGVLIPEELFKEMLSAYVKMEQVLATLETLADKDALKTIKKSREQVSKGEYVECSIDELENVLK